MTGSRRSWKIEEEKDEESFKEYSLFDRPIKVPWRENHFELLHLAVMTTCHWETISLFCENQAPKSLETRFNILMKQDVYIDFFYTLSVSKASHYWDTSMIMRLTFNERSKAPSLSPPTITGNFGARKRKTTSCNYSAPDFPLWRLPGITSREHWTPVLHAIILHSNDPHAKRMNLYVVTYAASRWRRHILWRKMDQLWSAALRAETRRER